MNGTTYSTPYSTPTASPQNLFGQNVFSSGNPLGGLTGGTIGGSAESFLPFQAGPQVLQSLISELVNRYSNYLPYQGGAQIAPQSVIGNLLSQLGQPWGNNIGGAFGYPQLGSTISSTLGQFAPFQAGPQVLQSLIGELVNRYSNYLPYQGGAQIAPQSVIGNLLSQLGQPWGNNIGGAFGYPQLGSTISSTLGQFAPFQAGPQVLQSLIGELVNRYSNYLPYQGGAQIAPQSVIGNLLSQLGQPWGNNIGGAFGYPQLGSTISSTLGQFAPFQAGPQVLQSLIGELVNRYSNYLPYQGGAQIAPQSVIGNLLSQLGQPWGNNIGGAFGYPQLGSTISSTLGQFAPFQAGPQVLQSLIGELVNRYSNYLPYQGGAQIAPQSVIGNLLSQLGQPWGNNIGGAFGYPQLGSTISSTLGQFAPFQAGPQVLQSLIGELVNRYSNYLPYQGGAQIAPQSVIGNLLSQLGQPWGNNIGGAFGYPQLGSTISSTLGQFAPFQAGPQVLQSLIGELVNRYSNYLPYQGGAQIAPQSVIGNLLSQLGQPWGNNIGGAFGYPQLGSTISSTLGQFAPFQAGPQVLQSLIGELVNRYSNYLPYQGGAQIAPQSVIGNLLSQLGQPWGNNIGGAFGYPQLGSTISSTLGQFAPFQAGPQVLQSLIGELVNRYSNYLPYQGGAQIAPQSVIGNLLSQLGQPWGNNIGGAFGYPQLGSTISSTLGQFAPFQAGPQVLQSLIGELVNRYSNYLPYQGGAQIAPQSVIGNLLSQLGQSWGSASAGAFGYPQLGSTIGSTLGQFAPFQAVPQVLQSLIGELVNRYSNYLPYQ